MPFWSLEPRTAAARAWIAFAYLGAVALFLFLQEIGLRLRREEHRAWWAGTGRDLLNAAGFAFLAGALRLYGFPAPAAMLVGGTLTLVLFGVYTFMATQTSAHHPRRWAVLLGLAVSLPALLWPGTVLEWFGNVAGALFPTR